MLSPASRWFIPITFQSDPSAKLKTEQEGPSLSSSVRTSSVALPLLCHLKRSASTPYIRAFPQPSMSGLQGVSTQFLVFSGWEMAKAPHSASQMRHGDHKVKGLHDFLGKVSRESHFSFLNTSHSRAALPQRGCPFTGSIQTSAPSSRSPF